MEKQMTKWTEGLPYPAITVCGEKKRMSRNRLAKRLLPPASRLRGQLSELTDDFMREMRLDGIAYLVLSMQIGENCRLFCFFEHFLPLQEALSRAIVENMQDFFWTLLKKEENPDFENLIRPEQIAARMYSLRRHGENYLRLINHAEIIGCGEAKSCCLGGFFRHLHKALDACGLSVSFRACEDMTVYSESGVLSFLVLNMIHFAHLFEAEKQLSVEVEEEGDGVRFSMKIPDCGEVRSSLEELILRGKENEKALSAMPMLCILRVCMEKGIPWTVTERSGELSLSFLIAKGDEKPVLFLSDATAAEVSELLQMVKGLFS